MVRKKGYSLILVFQIILILGCTSKFDKAQREKQESVTLSVSEKISINLSSLMNFLLEALQEPADVNSQNFLFLSQRCPEIAALFLYDSRLELIGKFPVDVSNDDIIENCLTNQNRRGLLSIKKPFIGHSLHINTNASICIAIPLSISGEENPYLVIALIDSEIFFSRIEQEYITPYPYSLIVINNEQDVVYDSDPMRIGKDFFTKFDSNDYDLAPKNLYNMMSENATNYFITNIEEQSGALKKIYTWHTIHPYDETFYVTLVRNLSRSTSKQPQGVYLLSTLRSYAIQDTLIDPIIDEKPEDVQKLLKLIYDNNPEVYSIQLADTTGTIITGWPLCNSIIGYSNAQKLNKSFDNALQKVIETKEESIIHSALLEGGDGKMVFIPVLVHEDLYGVLIAIEPEGN